MNTTRKPLVAIVGRPNVGKSTLFNRLAGRTLAIVSDVAGTTRDRVTTETIWAEHPFILVDTGGLDVSKHATELAPSEIWEKVRAQIDVAIDDADVILMLVDVSTGVTPADRDVAEVLRAVHKPVILAVNKADNIDREQDIYEFYDLGLGDPLPISAYHNVGVDDLMGAVVANFMSAPEELEPDADLKITLVGRTNAGKSMLLNALVGQERSIVSAIPGTTRDTVDTLITYDDEQVLIVDTAGLRRRGSVKPGIEKYSTLRSIRAIDRADIAVLVLDATELAAAQDTHIASYILDAYKGIVLAINKWDMAKELGLNKETATQLVRERFKFAPFAPICFISALRKSGLTAMMKTVQSVSAEWHKGVPRYDLRRTVLNAVAAHPPALSGRSAAKIYSVAQDATGPPSFTFYVNRAEMVHFGYQRYLENALRDAYGFSGSPLKMRFKRRGEK
jgi:GTP-binding protein